MLTAFLPVVVTRPLEYRCVKRHFRLQTSESGVVVLFDIWSTKGEVVLPYDTAPFPYGMSLLKAIDSVLLI